MGEVKHLYTVNKDVFGFIQSFLRTKSANSKTTGKDYERDIRLFFKTMLNKEIEKLTVEELVFENQEIEEYKMRLAETYAPKTVLRKISGIKSLYKKLEANNFPVKEAWFNVDPIKGESEPYAVVSYKQVQEMMSIVKNEVKGDIKEALLETASRTSFRLSSLLNLRWDYIENINGTWVLLAHKEAIGKGCKIDKKPIPNELYDKLMLLKEKYGEERIFPLQKNTVTKMMRKLRETMGLDENVTFHSLKKTGINEVYEITGGDILAVAEQGNHKSFGTVLKHYANKQKDFSEMASLKIGQDIDLSPIENLPHEDLLRLIKDCSNGLQYELLRKLNSNN